MKLWFIYRTSPAQPGETVSFVVRAENVTKARTLAANASGKETAAVWLDPSTSACDRLLAGGEPHFILREIKT